MANPLGHKESGCEFPLPPGALIEAVAELGSDDAIQRAWFRITDTIAISDEIPDFSLEKIRKAFSGGYRTALADVIRSLVETK